ncbi:M1 family aminopeptidase [Accumulibacter sp.]|uniref:M1 family metallopeptidase n=1 Tax=Accumulibacter sp. TaxID=2053492 RepID=UPI001A5037A7|nr:M1 family aminopeptidase [Accumulibacter sp.]MBL8374356.1 M1 family peptidase [Accumulibacter sp.]
MTTSSIQRRLALLLALVAPLPTALAATPLVELDVDLDPGSRRLTVVATITPVPPTFRFVLHESLAIAAASADGRPLPVTADEQQGSLRRWQLPLPAGSRSLRVEYQGTLPALDARLDHRQVLRQLPPMAAVEGSFLPAGGGWYPRPAELFRYRVQLSVPGDQRALVAGRLVKEELPVARGDRYRADFEFAHPADGIDLMAGPWIIREQMMARAGAEPLRLRTYFTRDLDRISGLADSYLDETRVHLASYAGMIGAYPFSSFSIVASPLPTGFGMPTLTYLGAEVLKLPFIRATSLGHEILHNWWGNGVLVDYASGNWAEGLTTFMADYAYQERESAAAARALRLGWLRDFAAVPVDSWQTLASFGSRMHGAAAAVGYGKSAMLFVMLRDLLGEDTFRRGLRIFWQEQRFRVASWGDLQQAFEQASGQALTPFFRQWLHRPGAPRPRIAAASTVASGGAYRLRLVVTQTAPAYALRLPIELNYGDALESRTLSVDGARQTLTLAVDRLPKSVRLDPDLRLWRMLAAGQLPPILRQWIVAREAQLLTVSGLPEVRAAATALASRLFEAPVREIAPDDVRRAATPVLLVGLHAEVDAALADAKLPPRPPDPDRRGTAQVWTMPGTPALAVISANDAEALRALLRPLPHYGSQSWLVFDGGRAIERGIWPMIDPPVPVTLLSVGAPAAFSTLPLGRRGRLE